MDLGREYWDGKNKELRVRLDLVLGLNLDGDVRYTLKMDRTTLKEGG